MILDAVGLTLPFAAAIALGPIPIVAAILVVDSATGKAAGWSFALGWAIGIAVLAALAGLLLESLGDGPADSPLANWLRILVGVLLLWAAVRKLRSRSDPDEAPSPRWLETLSTLSVGRALRVGVTLAVVNPKHVAFVAAAMAQLSYASASALQLAASVAAFTVLSASSVLAVVLYRSLGGPRAATALEAIRHYVIRHSGSIMVVVLVLLGASILGSGIAGLSP